MCVHQLRGPTRAFITCVHQEHETNLSLHVHIKRRPTDLKKPVSARAALPVDGRRRRRCGAAAVRQRAWRGRGRRWDTRGRGVRRGWSTPLVRESVTVEPCSGFFPLHSTRPTSFRGCRARALSFRSFNGLMGVWFPMRFPIFGGGGRRARSSWMRGAA